MIWELFTFHCSRSFIFRPYAAFSSKNWCLSFIRLLWLSKTQQTTALNWVICSAKAQLHRMDGMEVLHLAVAAPCVWAKSSSTSEWTWQLEEKTSHKILNVYATIYSAFYVVIPAIFHNVFGRTLQLFIHLQVHHHWWYGSGKVMSPPSVYREKMWVFVYLDNYLVWFTPLQESRNDEYFISVMADCPHTIGVEFGKLESFTNFS